MACCVLSAKEHLGLATAADAGDAATALATYTELFEFLMWFGVGAGVFMIIISPILRRWMHGIH